jgi:hypothetical protein
VTRRALAAIVFAVRLRHTIGARENLTEKQLRDVVGKVFVDVNLPASLFDFLLQSPNGLVHTRSFIPEAPSEVSGTQLFYIR